MLLCLTTLLGCIPVLYSKRLGDAGLHMPRFLEHPGGVDCAGLLQAGMLPLKGWPSAFRVEVLKGLVPICLQKVRYGSMDWCTQAAVGMTTDVIMHV